MRSFEATHNLLAVSATVREAALNTAATLDQTILINKDVLISPDFRNEMNTNEATGYEEPTLVYRRGKTASLPLSFDKAGPNHFGFLLAYALGACTSGTAGASGYQHTITPSDDWLESNRSNPTFTALMRYAKMEKRRWYSGMIKSMKASFPADDWAKLSAEIAFTGKYDSNIKKLSISGQLGATTLALTDAATTTDYAVEGASAAERLANIDYIRAEVASGQWADVTPTSASAATPAIVAFSAPGTGTTSITYEVVFVPDEESYFTFPAQVSESPLYVTDLSIVIAGKYNGTTIVGGHTVSGEVKGFDWDLTLEGSDPQFRPGGTGDYANNVRRVGRTQKITLNRDFMNMLLQQLEADEDTFAIQAKLTGAEYETGQSFEVDLIWPKCQVMNPKREVADGLLSETAEIAVLWDATYGSIVAKVTNQVEQYAQAS